VIITSTRIDGPLLSGWGTLFFYVGRPTLLSHAFKKTREEGDFYILNLSLLSLSLSCVCVWMCVGFTPTLHEHLLTTTEGEREITYYSVNVWTWYKSLCLPIESFNQLGNERKNFRLIHSSFSFSSSFINCRVLGSTCIYWASRNARRIAALALGASARLRDTQFHPAGDDSSDVIFD
jgi:hypothetical protein